MEVMMVVMMVLMEMISPKNTTDGRKQRMSVRKENISNLHQNLIRTLPNNVFILPTQNGQNQVGVKIIVAMMMA